MRGIALVVIGVVGLNACGSDTSSRDSTIEDAATPTTLDTTVGTTATSTVPQATTAVEVTSTSPATTTAINVPSTTAIAAEIVGPIGTELLDQMTLHLPDAPYGSKIGNDNSCNIGLSTDGARFAFIDVVGNEHDHVGACDIELVSPELSVNSVVVSYATAELARQAFTDEGVTDIIRYFGMECCPTGGIDVESPFRALSSVPAPGSEALASANPADTAAAIAWRQGALIGAVTVLRNDSTPGASAEAARLAEVQQQRMLNPAPLPDDIDDDLLAGLQQADFTPWWVGRTFTAPGFPQMELMLTSAWSSGLVDVSYDGVQIQVFDRSAVTPGSTPDQMLAVTAELFDSPCTVVEPIDGPGTSQLLGRYIPDEFFGFPTSDARTSWGGLATADCPIGEPNVWMATTELDDLYIQVNPVLCYNCLQPPTPDLPYRSPDGLRAIVAALEPVDG